MKIINKSYGKFLDFFIPLNNTQKLLKNISADEFLTLTSQSQTSIPPVKNTIAILNYKNKLVRQAVWALKFKNNIKISKIFGQIIYDYLIEELAELKLSNNFENPILIPIPISLKKKRVRGYNQTELIAEEVNKLDKNNFFDYRKNILKKIKNTLPQSHTKNKKERTENLKGCFKVVMPKLISGRNIILLDDVITTGATLIEAKRTLQQYNPKQIICITLAH